MCVQRVQRVLMGIIIILSVGLIHMGYFYEGSGILSFVGFMMIVWGIFNFCPSMALLRKFLPECKFGDNK